MGKDPNPAGLRHIETEQRRRDRINEGCANHSWLMYGSLVYMLLVGSLDVSSSIASNAASTGQKLQSHRLKHESGARTGRSPHPNALTCALTLQLCSPPRGAAKK